MKVGLCQQQRGELVIPDGRWRVAWLLGRAPGRAGEAGADSGRRGPLPSQRCPSSQSTSSEGESCVLSTWVSVQPTAHPRLPWEPSQTLGISTHLSLPDASQWATPTLSKLTMGAEVTKDVQVPHPSAQSFAFRFTQVAFTQTSHFCVDMDAEPTATPEEILAREHDARVCKRRCTHRRHAHWLSTCTPRDI